VTAVPIRRLVARIALATGFALAPIAWTPTPGWAAAGLVSSTPANGSALADPPAAVELTFASRPDPAQSHVAAYDSAGTSLDSAKLTGTGSASLRQPVAAAAHGTVVVAYHVVLAGGDEATGQIRFSVGTGSPPSTGDSAAQNAAEAVVNQHQHGADPLSAALLVVAALVLVGAILMLERPSLRRPPGLDDDQSAS
jgi:methionine-rich copper-binding protein CopC